ncbi:MAG TPA: hypothetical protein VFB80_14135 [Pirellulaceae bacterium]|nr:hypothetical protein [Pirellulaceae bacterium]
MSVSQRTTCAALSFGLSSWGVAQAEYSAIGPLRKQLPDWSAAGTAGHFLKHADEQTVMAVQAVDRAIREQHLDVREQANWPIVSAPRFPGRLAGIDSLKRFTTGGGPALSPQLIAQHSLHSVSGALSVLIGSRAQNLGVGGGADSLREGLLTALTMARPRGASGAWLVLTAYSPEPVIADDGAIQNRPVCQAAALALSFAAGASHCGRLSLRGDVGTPAAIYEERPLALAELVASLQQLAAGAAARFTWRLDWGATIALEVRQSAARLAAAA